MGLGFAASLERCLGILGSLVLAAPHIARADDMSMQDNMSGMAMMPQTASDHMEMAEMYKKKAAGYRADADMHRKMLADYTKGAATPPKACRKILGSPR